MVSSRTPSRDPDRALRDEQARARHKPLAGPHILARGKDGELHSYTLDEYGNSTHGLESQIRSVQRNPGPDQVRAPDRRCRVGLSSDRPRVAPLAPNTLRRVT